MAALRGQVITGPLAVWLRGHGGAAPGGGRPTPRARTGPPAPWGRRREIEAVLAVRQDAEARLVRLRDVLSRADRALAEARAERGEVLAKIAASEVTAVAVRRPDSRSVWRQRRNTAGATSGTGSRRCWGTWSRRAGTNCCARVRR
ncbi:hypothetical protein SBADM41S_04899 [Streptomyces badius]